MCPFLWHHNCSIVFWSIKEYCPRLELLGLCLQEIMWERSTKISKSGQMQGLEWIRLCSVLTKAMFSSILAMLVIWRIFSCGKHNFPNLCPPQWIFLWVVLQTIAYTSAYSVAICNPILTRLLVNTWVRDCNSSKIEGNLHKLFC